MELRNRTLSPRGSDGTNVNRIHHKTSPNAYSGVNGQSQFVESCRHNPMKSKNHCKHKHNHNNNKKQKSTSNKAKAKNVELSIFCYSVSKNAITINVDLSSLHKNIEQKSKEIKDKIEQEMQKKYYPQKFSVVDWSSYQNFFVVYVRMKHDISAAGSQISCQHIKNTGKCPIFEKVKEDYEYTEEYFKHLNEFTHFKDIYDKELCRYMDDKKYDEECLKYSRLQKGGNRLDDRCHMKIYRHPPRNREINITSHNKPFLMNDSQKYEPYRDNVYIPTNKDKKKWNWSRKDGYLYALIAEIKKNGFESDLIIQPYDKKNKIKKKKQKYTILRIVDEKIKHSRHKTLGSPLNRGEMLSIVLYTGCECNWYLSEDERNNNTNKLYNDKWKWMEYCLDSAITKLHAREGGKYKIYTGLRTTNLVRNRQSGKFKTFVSASWKKDIAIDYMNNDKKNNNGGMIIEMERDLTDFGGGIVCADVSWISKFSDECEVLIRRGTFMNLYVEDTQDSWQNVKGSYYDGEHCPNGRSRSIAECLLIHFNNNV